MPLEQMHNVDDSIYIDPTFQTIEEYQIKLTQMLLGEKTPHDLNKDGLLLFYDILLTAKIVHDYDQEQNLMIMCVPDPKLTEFWDLTKDHLFNDPKADSDQATK